MPICCFLSYSDYKVPLVALSESQLALCHPERELLPLVLANCHYTLEKGQQTVSSLDHQAIERELSRRFFSSKPRIQTVSPIILNLIILLVFNIWPDSLVTKHWEFMIQNLMQDTDKYLKRRHQNFIEVLKEVRAKIPQVIFFSLFALHSFDQKQ